MPKLDRYLFREFTQSFLATLIILLMVSVGGVMADLLGDVADGKVPARLLLSQLGLQFLNYMPYIIPLALMLGLLLAFSRLYRDSEMAVLTAAGIGPRRLLRQLLMLVVPVVVIVGLCSLWLGGVVSLLLLGRFLPAFLKSKSLYPAGIMAALSLVGVVIAVARLF